MGYRQYNNLHKTTNPKPAMGTHNHTIMTSPHSYSKQRRGICLGGITSLPLVWVASLAFLLFGWHRWPFSCLGGIASLPLVEGSLAKGVAIPNYTSDMLHCRHSAAASCRDSLPILWRELPGTPRDQETGRRCGEHEGRTNKV